MKSKHLARADFLRQLSHYALELYELRDNPSQGPKKSDLESRIRGFVDAGLTIDLVTPDEIQGVIDKAHLDHFGEERQARRDRVRRESTSVDPLMEQGDLDWDMYDSPTIDRRS